MAFHGREAFRILERFARRKLDVIRTGDVIGAVSAIAEGGTGGSEESLCGFDQFQGVALRLDLRVVVRGQSLDLLDVEDGISPHEGDLALDLFALVVGCRPGDPIGKDDE
jgi:hypothetical protein